MISCYGHATISARNPSTNAGGLVRMPVAHTIHARAGSVVVVEKGWGGVMWEQGVG